MRAKTSIKILLIAVAAGILLTIPSVSRADGEKITGVQLSLCSPLQLFPEPYGVNGLRLDAFEGVNQDVEGIDLGFFNKAKGHVYGFELGVVNDVDNGVRGIQAGVLANISRGESEGLQAAIFYNDVEDEMHGVQVGIVNHAGSLDGVQIGLLNFNDDKRYQGFLPFINAAF